MSHPTDQFPLSFINNGAGVENNPSSLRRLDFAFPCSAFQTPPTSDVSRISRLQSFSSALTSCNIYRRMGGGLDCISCHIRSHLIRLSHGLSGKQLRNSCSLIFWRQMTRVRVMGVELVFLHLFDQFELQ